MIKPVRYMLNRREIKFRAWDGCTMVFDTLWIKTLYRYDRPMQFIGRKDKSGEEVYEGDILEITGATCNEYDFKGIVIFYDGTFCLASLRQSEGAKKHGYTDKVRFWKDGCHDHHSIEMIEDFEMEVVGNVFENRELLPEGFEIS